MAKRKKKATTHSPINGIETTVELMARRKKKKKVAALNPISGTEATVELKIIVNDEAQRALKNENGALRLVIHQMAMELEALRVELAILRSSCATSEPQVWTHETIPR